MTIFIVMYCEKGLTIADRVFTVEEKARDYIASVGLKKTFFYVTKAVLEK